MAPSAVVDAAPGGPVETATLEMTPRAVIGASVEAAPAALPREPRDLFATYGAVPGDPEELARRFTHKAYTLEIIAWVLLLAGISLNAFFVGMIIFFLG
jgi:hypothetical protein